ncbi:LysR family transcriptional regulator [Salipiger aestuarii]|uniref:hydrogen peroxide-inducible genes activator n=1 Tax=Salipiger aestuarii TaxID=568098 RepID=UPI00025B78E8|nr:hydrogen peroxide-inducible genes activator [Salipiger aestuarii]EIE52078.1 LysR family transcriptional regulator [Citreicella sp. 357]KAA8608138.1 LysR family transcriptional regulator [Salipiger aestuarii]KAA8611328.1 LysR family transcriptional regulator [Salipiger aestuarii]
MTSLTMKHLRYFDALARLGHFGRAAETCAISQPALSMQIKELEQLVGAPLVERGARQIRLTGLGEDFAERVSVILSAVDDLTDLARASQGQLTGRLRIGVIPTVAPYLLPRIIMALSATHPALDLFPREAVTGRLIDELMAARLDAAIVALPVSEPSLEEVALFEEEFVLVRALNEADQPVPDPGMLHEMRLLLLEEGHCFRDQALSFCKLSPDVTRELMEGSSLSTLVQMVGAGIGITLVPEMAVPIETRSAEVSIARLPEPRPRRTVGMVWRRSNPLGAQLERIAGIVRRVGLETQSAAHR